MKMEGKTYPAKIIHPSKSYRKLLKIKYPSKSIVTGGLFNFSFSSELWTSTGKAAVGQDTFFHVRRQADLYQ